MQFCSVVETNCEAPAGHRTGSGSVFFGIYPAKFECRICTQPVCGKCSKLRKRDRRMIRICLTCIAEQKK